MELVAIGVFRRAVRPQTMTGGKRQKPKRGEVLSWLPRGPAWELWQDPGSLSARAAVQLVRLMALA